MTLRLVTASALAAALLSGCAVTIGPSSSPATPLPASPASPATPATPAEPASPATPVGQSTPAEQPAERTWTYDLVVSSTRPAEATSAQLRGTSDAYPNSTSLWVGCEGVADEVVLATNGRYKRLFGHLGLRADVPAGLVVHTLVSVDGKPVQNIQLDADDANAVEVNVVLTDVQRVTFQSQAVKGQCGSSEESYVVLGDGYVE
ncbi:MAG: hypothetical protein QM804_01065 [Propionicimonas sp.]